MKYTTSLFCSFSMLTFLGCATVSERVEQVESTATKSQQIQAQKSLETPVVKSYKRKLAVARFSNETNYGRALLTDEQFDRIGKQASDMLSSRLVKSGKFLVFERPDIKKIEMEQKYIPDAKMIGVDTLVVGSVTEFGRFVGGKSGFLSSTKNQVARAKVEIRLVDPTTGHAFFSASGTGEANTESGEIAGFGSRAEYDATLNDRAIAAAVSDVIDKLVATLDERQWKTSVLSIDGLQVFISGGRRQGLKIGDRLQVMASGKRVVSKQTGFEMELPATKLASIKIVSFFGDSETNEGSVCELIDGTINNNQLQSIFVTEIK